MTATSLPRIITALSPEQQIEAALRAKARADERKRKRDMFLRPPEDDLPAGWRWHVVQSEARRELTAAEEIDKLGFRPWVPSVEKEIVDKRRFSRTRARPKKIVRRTWFTNYLFVGFAPKAAWSEIAHARGVAGMVMAVDKPEPVPEIEMAKLLNQSRYNFGQPIKRQSKFVTGAAVRSVDGPFESFDGEIEAVDSSLRITVLMSLFGRKVRVTCTEEMLELIG